MESLVYAPRRKLAEIKGVGDQRAERIQVLLCPLDFFDFFNLLFFYYRAQAEAMRLVPSGFTSATEMHIRRSHIIQVGRAPPIS